MIRVPRRILDDLIAHGQEGHPNEVCGILAGKRDGDATEIVRHYRMRNVHPNLVKEYAFDPQEQLRVTLEVEDDLGLEVVGFYHSHPRGPPHLSKTDEAKASWPGTSYFLLWFREDGTHEGYGSWTWNGDTRAFDPETVTVF